ncbi:MAG: hypothetical protein R3B96_10405 [Pirellulaceae bacterium]
MYLTVEHLLPFQDLKRYAYDHSLPPRRTADLYASSWRCWLRILPEIPH